MTEIVLVLLVLTTPQMPLSVATTDDARAIFANPAGLAVGYRGDFYLLYNSEPVVMRDIAENVTLCGNLGPLGAFWEPKPGRYGLALGVGAREFMAGARFMRDARTHWDLGVMSRPAQWLSLGILWHDLNTESQTWQFGAAVRPLGNRLTLFGELYTNPLGGAFGVEAEPLDGLEVALRVAPAATLEGTGISAGVTLGFGKAGLGLLGMRAPGQVAGFVRLSEERRRSLFAPGRKCVSVKLREEVSDRKPGFSLAMRPTRTTWELLDLLRRCRTDKGVRAVLLEFDGLGLSVAQAQELRSAIAACRAAGKKVYAYGDGFGMLTYYIASACNKVVCHRMGGVEIPGVSATVPFLKGTLEKLGLVPDATRHGKYKSAVEIFTEDSLTPPNREQYEAMLDAIYGELVPAMASGRGIDPDSLEQLVSHAWFLAEDAYKAGLVDTFCYRDELDSILKRDLRGLRRVSEEQFTSDEAYEYDWQDAPALAVIYATGSIGNGESGTDFLTGEATMGAQTMARAIAAARKDSRVKAILLRIDSPGGDGFASDIIWHELELAAKKKPVIVSMAGVAASGGYYIACNAKKVFALPTTLTGSIGVFSLKFVTEGLYNKLGARRQTITRGEHADASSDVREYTAEEDSMVQAMADRFYWQFVEKVAAGRKLTVAHVDSVGQGRVWSGKDAREVGLVDSLGGLMEAVEFAKHEAGLTDCDYLFFPKPRTDFMSKLGTFVRERVVGVVYE